jgi:alpha-tubulin suppressor-like RCC1 family protein
MNGNYEITADFEYIPMIAAGAGHTVGLRSNRSVVTMGDNLYGQCEVSGWDLN